ncbi:MAG: diaminopimelate decarboxylase [Leptotrichiaceae bacterium]|jgi:diaminopimelate decarboxylase|nr:diaminopimelate decarboxylase [Leptotrichiaceae bacterium]MBP6168323.1 diaminopimelate decarboxylase [Leptotrichiaceae bacterium]MBP9596750.1 diaminopimelate decarboxylase [Fusobacteriaceae bacterium]MBP9876337.1 diaminopimelate decarboxylase [Leptotrichiaceae bacterium]
MKLFGTSKVNENGNLEIGGVDTVSLVAEHSTPLYVMDQTLIEETIDSMKVAFKSERFETQIAYAGKAFLTMAMVKIVDEKGLDLDVVSEGELYTAYKAGFPMNRVHMHGNNKTTRELEMAIELGIKEIVIDNEDEIIKIENICRKKNKKQAVLLRIDPGIEAHTHQYIKTSGLTSKFGISLFQKNLFDIVKRINDSEFFEFKGFHTHIGSQIFQSAFFMFALDEIFKYLDKLKKELGIIVETVNMGGGFGVYYTEEDDPAPIDEVLKEVITYTEAMEIKYRIGFKTLCIEPGRSIVGNAGTTIYSVGGIKETVGGKTYVFVDGGMADNIRPALYQAKYEAAILSKMNEEPDKEVTLAGKFCESGDVLIDKVKLSNPQVGDLVGITTTGAYCYSMSSNYNRFAKPAVVFVKDGKSKVIVKRETLEDLIRNDEM